MTAKQFRRQQIREILLKKNKQNRNV